MTIRADIMRKVFSILFSTFFVFLLSSNVLPVRKRKIGENNRQ
ncbi:hypothetical protein BTJ45_01437 [Bacillus mycoides]|nr:hypothetical protein BTJ45_01437 [Bacillus mycoides]